MNNFYSKIASRLVQIKSSNIDVSNTFPSIRLHSIYREEYNWLLIGFIKNSKSLLAFSDYNNRQPTIQEYKISRLEEMEKEGFCIIEDASFKAIYPIDVYDVASKTKVDFEEQNLIRAQEFLSSLKRI